MTANVQQGTILDVLKKKMRQTKEEMEKYKDDCEEIGKRLQVEVMRREEVSRTKSMVSETEIHRSTRSPVKNAHAHVCNATLLFGCIRTLLAQSCNLLGYLRYDHVFSIHESISTESYLYLLICQLR